MSSPLDVLKDFIDLDADPTLPCSDWKVEEHRKGGQLIWSPQAVNLHLSPNQMGDKSIRGHKLRQELADKPTLNANARDYLIHHPHLIPEEWKVDEHGNTRYVYFWGTIYRNSDGDLSVRCLCFVEGRWQTRCLWLYGVWRCGYPAVVRAS